MQLAEQHIIRKGDNRWLEIDLAAFKSKNLYNAAMYRIRQHYFATQTYLTYFYLEKGFKSKALLDDQRLQISVVQQVLMQVDQEWRGYFAALQMWKVHPEKFTGKPRFPGYKDKSNGRNLLVFTKNAISRIALKRGQIKLAGLTFEIPTRIQPEHINQVRIVPRSTHYVIEVIYTVQPQPVPSNKQHVAGIDMGIDNVVALASNQPGFTPLLVNGKLLKSINQWYNKRLAVLQAQLPKHQYRSKQIQALTFKRNCRVNNYLHQTSKWIMDWLVERQIGTLVIGKNVGWKQAVELGKVNNQKFVPIPHARLIEMLTYKAALVGIDVVLTEESYTSKCSFLDGEALGKHEQYAGRRVRRSEFVSADGRRIHADVNAAYNMIRKVVPNAFDASGIEAYAVMPVRVLPV
jgi:IS605 OrfB family transposase